MSSTEQRRQVNGASRVDGLAFAGSADNLLQLAVPPGTPIEAERAIQRLLELTTVLARRASQLQEALDSRVIIEQAKGVLAERYGLELDQAFDLIRRTARSNRMKLHDLVRKIQPGRPTPEELTESVRGLAPRRPS
jgi:hypothetical protein